MEGGTSSALCPYVGGYRGGTMPPDGDALNEGHIDVVLFLARTCGWRIPRPLLRRKPAIIQRHGSGHQLLSHTGAESRADGSARCGLPRHDDRVPACAGPRGENTMRKLLLITALCLISATAFADDTVKWHHVQHVAAIQSQDVGDVKGHIISV
jgi:hypothetical protein